MLAKKRGRIIAVIAMVAAISVSLWFASPVKAVTVTLPTVPSTMYTGTSYTIVAQIDTRTNESPVFTSLSFTITGPATDTCVFNTEGDITSAGTYITDVTRSYSDYAMAYSGYYLGQTGYAYTDSAYSINTMFKYNIAIATSSIPTGDYTAQLTMNAGSTSYTSPTYSFSVIQQSGGGGGTISGSNQSQSTSLSGFTGSNTLTINSGTGVVANTFTATSGDGKTTVTVPAGTVAKNLAGTPISTLTANAVTPPTPPANHNVIGLAYDFGPNGTQFNPAIEISFTLSPDDIPAGLTAEDMLIAYYDTATGTWVELPVTVENGVLTATVSHFTTFAVIAPPTQASPAAFSTSTLNISPAEVDIAETVNVSVVVSNTGEDSGTYVVTFKLNNAIIASEEVTLDGGANTTVAFTTAGDTAGTYQVDVNGQTGSFTVVEATTTPTDTATPTPTDTSTPTTTPTDTDAGGLSTTWIIVIVVVAVIVVGIIIWMVMRKRE